MTRELGLFKNTELDKIPMYKSLAFTININKAKYHRSDKIILSDIEITIENEHIALIGTNGCGKSTLLKLLANKLDASISYEGYIQINTRCKIFNYTQDFPNIQASPLEYFMERYNLKVYEAHKLLGQIGLVTPQHKMTFNKLSGGEKARVVFAEIMLMKPNVLLLDEPTNHLDIDSINELIGFINSFPGAVVFSTHNKHLIRNCASNIWLIEDGKIIEIDDFEEYLQNIYDQIELSSK